jgi:hypothetical protein
MVPLAISALAFLLFLLSWLFGAPQVRLAVNLFGANPHVQTVVGWAPLGLASLFAAIVATNGPPPSVRRPWSHLATACTLLALVILPPIVGNGGSELTGDDAAALIAQAYGFHLSWIAVVLLVIPYRLFVWIRARLRQRSPTQWPPHGRALRWTLAVVELVALAALLPWAGQVVEVMTRVWGVEP